MGYGVLGLSGACSRVSLWATLSLLAAAGLAACDPKDDEPGGASTAAGGAAGAGGAGAAGGGGTGGAGGSTAVPATCEALPGELAAFLASAKEEWGDDFAPYVEEAASFVKDHDELESPDFQSAEAAAWTVVGQTALLLASPELTCLGFIEASLSDPASAVAMTNVAFCLIERQSWELAKAALDCAMDLDPKLPAPHVSAAYVHYAYDGDVEGALASVEEAVALDPATPEWQFQAVMLAGELGDTAKAEKHLAALPAEGYRGSMPSSGGGGKGGWCCLTEGVSYDSLYECQQCTHTLACLDPCRYSAECDDEFLDLCLCQLASLLPCEVRVCVPLEPPGKICFSVAPDCTFGIEGAIEGLDIAEVAGGYAWNPDRRTFAMVGRAEAGLPDSVALGMAVVDGGVQGIAQNPGALCDNPNKVSVNFTVAAITY